MFVRYKYVILDITFDYGLGFHQHYIQQQQATGEPTLQSTRARDRSACKRSSSDTESGSESEVRTGRSCCVNCTVMGGEEGELSSDEMFVYHRCPREMKGIVLSDMSVLLYHDNGDVSIVT